MTSLVGRAWVVQHVCPGLLLAPVNDDLLNNYADWDLRDLLTFGGPDLRSALKEDFDCLGTACNQAGLARPSTLANSFAVAQEGLKSQLELSGKVALVVSSAERTAIQSACCTSLQGTISERQS